VSRPFCFAFWIVTGVAFGGVLLYGGDLWCGDDFVVWSVICCVLLFVLCGEDFVGC